MGSSEMCLRLVLVQLVLSMVANAALTTTQLAQLPKPDCIRKCGELESIPYPFGTEADCYLNEDFFINCSNTDNPPMPFLRKSIIRVTNITMDGRLQVQSYVSRDCYDENGKNTNNTPSLNMSQSTISDTQNKFTVIGCGSYGYIQGEIGEKYYSVGCGSSCVRLEDVTNGSCSGFGCCQIDIPRGLKGIAVQASSLDRHKKVLHFNPCSYAFVIEGSRFNFSSSNLSATITKTVPTAVDWAITGHGKCEEARNNQSYACKENSNCYEPSDHSAGGYLCKCKDGYQGNPYISNDCRGKENLQASRDLRLPTLIQEPQVRAFLRYERALYGLVAEVSRALIAMEKVSSTGQKSREDDSSAKTSESPVRNKPQSLGRSEA
ncbi:hypothetical protein LWI29_000656 [Acer saccharum]|uniref:Wall-associated receptor kinase galacturonan-binding domain-containing protein n=1 Tax=Acer saccharum TaxID=4024 RepID=A0AA39SMG5_ACESA|nr:hypothetical protein LWI29_000656 [Acer saccharum]